MSADFPPPPEAAARESVPEHLRGTRAALFYLWRGGAPAGPSSQPASQPVSPPAPQPAFRPAASPVPAWQMRPFTGRVGAAFAPTTEVRLSFPARETPGEIPREMSGDALPHAAPDAVPGAAMKGKVQAKVQGKAQSGAPVATYLREDDFEFLRGAPSPAPRV